MEISECIDTIHRYFDRRRSSYEEFSEACGILSKIDAYEKVAKTLYIRAGFASPVGIGDALRELRTIDEHERPRLF